MPKLISFQIKVKTGDAGMQEPVSFSINSHVVPFENVKGGTGPGETLECDFEVNSFAHSLTLVGPKKGTWNIREMVVGFKAEHTEPYSVRFGEVTLDETNEVNIWRDPPLPTFDV